MSPPPQGGVVVPLSSRSETKNSERPTGVGQKSAALELTGSPIFRGSCQGESIVARSETQMSLPPTPFGRVEAKSRLNPSGASMGQPSADGAGRFTPCGSGTAVVKLLGPPPCDSACTDIRDVAVPSSRARRIVLLFT